MRLLHVAGNAVDFRALAVWKAIAERDDEIAQRLLTERPGMVRQHPAELHELLGVEIEQRVVAAGTGVGVEPLASTLAEVDRVLSIDPPDAIVVYGSCDTCVAAAISGANRGIPVAHYPAGARVGSFRRSAEANRVAIDYHSCLHLCETPAGSENVRNERIPTRGAPVVGFLNADVLDRIPGQLLEEPASPELASVRGEYLAAVFDHPLGMEGAEHAASILADLQSAATRMPVALLITERVSLWLEGRLAELAVGGFVPVEPVGPLAALRFLAGAGGVITDMYWVMEMACHLGRPCVALQLGDRVPRTIHPDDLLVSHGWSGDLDQLADRIRPRFHGPGERCLDAPGGAGSRAAAALSSGEWLEAAESSGVGAEG